MSPEMDYIEKEASRIILEHLKPPKYSGGSWTMNPDEATRALREAGLLRLADDIMPHDSPEAGADCYGSYCPECNCCQHTLRICDLEGICPNPICSCGNGGVFDG